MKYAPTFLLHILRNAILSVVGISFVFSPLVFDPAIAEAQGTGGAAGGVATNVAACIGLGSILGGVKKQITKAATSVGAVPVKNTTIEESTAETAQHTADANQKECALDALAYSVAKLLLQQITQNVVAYINSGFNGNPAFITNPGEFFKDIGDQVAGELIYGSELNFLCSPFQDILRQTIKIRYRKLGGKVYDRARCTLTDVLNNIEDFQNNNFSNGKLSDLFDISQIPANNSLGAYIEVSAVLDERIARATGLQETQLNWSKGVLSELDPDGNIVNPGAAIESQLENVLGSGVRQLELADEFNEILGALMGQLTQQVFGGGGLLSGGGSKSGGFGNDINTKINDSNSSLVITSPKLGDPRVSIGDTMTISWRTTGTPTYDGVQIYVGNSTTRAERPLFDSASSTLTFAKGSQYVWTIPDLLASFSSDSGYTPSEIADGFYLRAQMVKKDRGIDTKIGLISDPVAFAMNIPVVISPAGGESIRFGTSSVVRWDPRSVNGRPSFDVYIMNTNSNVSYVMAQNVRWVDASTMSVPWSVDTFKFRNESTRNYVALVCIAGTLTCGSSNSSFTLID